MADLCGRDKLHDAFRHAKTRTQNGNYAKLPSGQHICLHRRNGGLNINLLQGEVTGDFVCHERGQLLKQHTEILCSGVLVPHQRQLVLNQRMIDDGYIFHIVFHVCLQMYSNLTD